MARRLLFMVFLTFFASFVITSPVQAQTASSSNTRLFNLRKTESDAVRTFETEGREAITNLREARAARNDVRCAAITARINARIGFYNQRKDAHVRSYQNIKERVQTLVSMLNEKGVDTTELTQDLTQLESLIATAANDYSTFITKLEATKGYNCADSDGDFAQALKDAQAALRTFHSDVTAIRDFIQNTLKPDLQAIKQQRVEAIRNAQANDAQQEAE